MLRIDVTRQHKNRGQHILVMRKIFTNIAGMKPASDLAFIIGYFICCDPQFSSYYIGTFKYTEKFVYDLFICIR